MTTNDQDEKITLAALLGGIWPKNPFMDELARKTPTTLREFMDWADEFINAEDTLKALTAPQRFEMEQADRKAARQRGDHEPSPQKGKKTSAIHEEKGSSIGPIAWRSPRSHKFGSRRRS